MDEKNGKVDPLVSRIANNATYIELKKRRTRFGLWLALAMMIVYYGFIALVAFDKAFMAQRLGSGVTTIGIPIGIGVIFFTILITAVYVVRANGEYDTLTEKVVREVTR